MNQNEADYLLGWNDAHGELFARSQFLLNDNYMQGYNDGCDELIYQAGWDAGYCGEDADESCVYLDKYMQGYQDGRAENQREEQQHLKKLGRITGHAKTSLLY
jgi:hypothetical protein